MLPNSFLKLSQKLHKQFNRAKFKTLKKINLWMIKALQTVIIMRNQMLKNWKKWVKRISLNFFSKTWIITKNSIKILKKQMNKISLSKKMERKIFKWVMDKKEIEIKLLVKCNKTHLTWSMKLLCTLQSCGIEIFITL